MHTYTQHAYSPTLTLALGSLPAILATLLLFWLMHSLIAGETPAPDERVKQIDELVVVPDDPIILEPDPPPVKPDDAAPPPKWTSPLNELTPDSDDLAWAITAPVPSGNKNINLGVGGGGVVAYLKPQPIYPSRALTRGIEGYVDLAFDITAAGSTANIRIIESQPPGVFDRAASNALKKWKYKVPVIDDKPQGQVDMMTRMTFELED